MSKPGYCLLASKDGKPYKIMSLDHVDQAAIGKLYKEAAKHCATVEELPTEAGKERFLERIKADEAMTCPTCGLEECVCVPDTQTPSMFGEDDGTA